MKKILIVEDEVAYLKLLHTNLVKSGYKVIEALDGKKGLEMAQLDHPDLILLDIRMPVMDGMTMLGLLRKDPWGADVPVLMLTNLDDSKSISTTMNDNVKKYIVKSDWKLTDIITEVGTTLKAN